MFRGTEILFRYRHRRLLVHALSLLLLIAQLGIEVHASSHLSSEQHGIPSAIQACNQCLSFAPLLNIAGASHAIRLAPPPIGDGVLREAESRPLAHQPCAAFRSRAPPVLV